MKRITLVSLVFLLVLSMLIMSGCGPQGPALSAQNILNAMVEKNNKLILAECSKETNDYINSGFTKDIYGENLPIDYLNTLLGTKSLKSAKVEIKEEKGDQAIVKITINKKDTPLYFQKVNNKWLFDMPNTITLSEANPKEQTIAAVEKTEIAFTKNDYPTTVGIETRYFANQEQGDGVEPVPPAEVSFNLEGPWDFLQGPTESEKVITVVDKNQAPDMASFPDANLVERCDFGQLYDDCYNLNNDDGLIRYSDINHFLISKSPGILTYSPPWFELKYPAKVGSTWQDTYQFSVTGEIVENQSYQTIRTSKIVSVNQIKTPFKSYDRCFLVQYHIEEQKPGGTETSYSYVWLVPHVGQVAVIKSLPGETNEVFTQAERIWRLKYQGKETPAGTPQQ